MVMIGRRAYAEIYGPTTGDLVRLGDTSLLAEIEHDFTVYGDELTTGAGKSMRDGEGFQTTGTYASGALDMVIHNAMIVDAVAGIVKADIGIRDGRIVGIGKAGNPDVMAGVHPELRTGPNTTCVHGDFSIVTAGAIEGHAHFLSPQQCDHALAGGTTTMIGMSPGPNFDTSCSGPNVLGGLIRACDHYCLNFGFLGRGASDPDAVEETVAGGALGVKIHEDLGASPAVLDGSLIAADRNDFAVHLHTDTINEFGFCEDTMAAVAGRTIHMYHVEGAGGGHAPDLLRVNSWANVIPSSTNPTNPFTAYALEEGVPMTMLAHMMNYKLPEDVAFAESRIRAQSMAAEDFLHDMGAISCFATDTQGMGRLAENVAKCWQLASVMKDRVGRLPEETTARADNERIKRYVAKLTINPAIAVGIDEHVGSIEPGKMADLVLWPRNAFGSKPQLVIKGGQIVWATMGDGNASQIGSEPMIHRPMWGALGTARHHLGVTFVSTLAMESGARERLGAAKRFVPIRSVRRLTKADMVRNAVLPAIEVDPQTFEVRADGRLLTCPPAAKVPLNRRYMLR
ncbi:urease subunit alpha [Oharaeibacter diazotrophicus]|uniref:Urease subunit alpha n=1 Tax=Oharaeibacter diazotrophicus TaxID=1920512 RepID=A0A4V3CV54_9HYPH|nr:urease subunit alpha [Oharaeibacter diazotrophicus]TDP81128.1 urease [Oharaeibacter diazotrophicus]BBE74879.1 urease subunit alpha [Pleomorphomonas sp. SM30]GLS75617.1 urease subunit alpha [Oharaeibacter diazotrophicus]